MASRDLIKAVAKTAAATAFGGPLAGAGTGVNEAIDIFAGRFGRRDKDVYSVAIERLERGLEAFARSEGLRPASVDQALVGAQTLIDSCGATADEMVRLGLDPKRIGDAVLKRGAGQLRLLDEGPRELSRTVVHSVYASLLADDAAPPGVEGAYRRRVLGALEDLPAKVADAVAAGAPPSAAPAADLRELFRGVLERHTLFAGRERELDLLDRAAAAARAQVGAREASGQYLCISGPAGFGKSALLANWVTRVDAGADVAFAFVNRLAGTADETTILRALCQQLLPHADRAQPLLADPPDLRARLRGLLTEPPANRPSIVVVDGLDEADWLIPGLLPDAPPPGRLIVLSRRATSDGWVSDLGLQRRAVTSIALETLSTDDIAALLRAAGDPAAALAADTAFVEALRAGGDPLYVRLLVEDVCEGRIRTVADLRRQPAGLEAYFDRWWEEITAVLSGPALRDLLGYLVVAKGPIGRAELVAVDDDDALDEFGGDGVPPADTVLARARRFLVGDDSGLALGHPRFEDYLRDTRFNDTLIDIYSTRLCAYCARWAKVHRLGPYALMHYVEHLGDRGATDELGDVLADPDFISTKARTLGIDALIADYAVPEASPAVASIGRALRRSRMTLAREPEQLAAQLHGRLVGVQDDPILRLVAGIGAIAPRYWLAARTPALASAQDLEAMLTSVGTVRALAFGSLGAATMLAVGVDDRVELHDPLKGSSEHPAIHNDGLRVTAVCLGTLDGQPIVVVAAGHDGRLVVRDATAGEPVGDSVPLPAYVDSLAVGMLGDALVVAAAGNRDCWAWDLRTREPVEITPPAGVVALTTLDGRVTYAVVGPGDGGTPMVALVDAATLREARPPVFRGIATEPRAFAAAEVGDTVVMALLWPSALCGVWSAESGDSVGPYLDLGDAPIRCIAVGHVAGHPLVAASPDYAGTGVILLRQGDGTAPENRRRPISDFDRPIHGLRADAAGTVTALTGLGLGLREVLVDGEATLGALGPPPSAETVALMLTGATTPHDFTEDLETGGVKLVDEGDLGARGTASAERLSRSAPLQWPATATSWAALDGRAVVAVGSYGGAVWIWDIVSRSLLAGPFADVPEELIVARREIKAARPPHVTSIAIGGLAGRDVLATACGGKVRVWDVRTGERLPAPQAGDEVVDRLALGTLHGDDVLVTGSRGGVLRVWDPADGRRVAGITLDAGIDGVWVVRGTDAVAALTGDSHLHVLDLRAGGV
jgi:WD40 repeat protein